MGVTNFSLYLPKLMAPTRYVKINCSSYREQFVQLTCTKYSVAVNMGNDMDHENEFYLSHRGIYFTPRRLPSLPPVLYFYTSFCPLAQRGRSNACHYQPL